MKEVHAHMVCAIIYALSGQKVTIRNAGGGNFVLAKHPSFDENRKPTKAQQKVRTKFSAATSYAQKALADPKLAALYKAKATQVRSAFNIACMDYLIPPVVRRIETAEYTGIPGSTILIRAIDNFQIKSVEVKILNPQGEVVEKGKAIIDPILKLKWIYTVTKHNALLSGCKIQAIAKDLAGNTGKLETIL